MSVSPVSWPFCATGILLKPSYIRSSTEFGAQSHEFGSAHWMLEASFKPSFTEAERSAYETLIHDNNGRGLFGVFDRRRPKPLALIGTGAAVPALTVTGTSKVGTITVTGTAGDVISRGDPIGFTHNNRRHYYKFKDTVALTGVADVLRVFISPRVDLAGISAAAERDRPECYFNVQINDVEGITDLRQTPITLVGREYFGDVL